MASVSLSQERDRFVADLLSYMTLDEKLGQLDLFHPPSDPRLEAAVAAGRVGGVAGGAAMRRLQMLAVDRSRLGIPLLLFAEDQPDPVMSPWAAAASWDGELTRSLGAQAAAEAAAGGHNCLLAPRVWLDGAASGTTQAHIATSEPLLAARLVAEFATGAIGDGSANITLAPTVPAVESAQDQASLQCALSLFGTGELGGLDCAALDGSAASHAGFGGLLVAECRRLRSLLSDRFSTTSARSALEAAERSLAEGLLSESEIDAAVRGVLTIKHGLGLFRDPVPARAMVTETDGRADIVRRTMVLLRNEAGLLPLSPISDRVLVVGSADGAGGACSAALSRAGIGHAMAPGLALRRAAEPWATPVPGDHFALSLTRDAAQRADFVLVVLDERHFQPAAEGQWQQPTPAVLAMLRALAPTSSRLAAIVATDEPVDLAGADQHFAAVLHCWKPRAGFEEALADLLAGRHSPQARLPVSTGRFSVGHGLGFGESVFSSYTLTLADDHVRASLRVRNAGNFPARETIQVYVAEPGAAPRLVAFEHVILAPGEDVPVEIELGVAELGAVSQDGRQEVVPGRHEIRVGKSAARLLSAHVDIDRATARAMTFGAAPFLRAVRK